jgi:hypothetical protein
MSENKLAIILRFRTRQTQEYFVGQTITRDGKKFKVIDKDDALTLKLDDWRTDDYLYYTCLMVD